MKNTNNIITVDSWDAAAKLPPVLHQRVNIVINGKIDGSFVMMQTWNPAAKKFQWCRG